MFHQLSRSTIRHWIVTKSHMWLFCVNSSISYNTWIMLWSDILIIYFYGFHCLVSCRLQLILLILLIITNVEVLFLGINSSFLSTIIILILPCSRCTRWRSPFIWLVLIWIFVSKLKLSFSEIQSSLLSLIKGVLRSGSNLMTWKVHLSNWNVRKSLFSRAIIEILLFGLDYLRRVFAYRSLST